MKIFVHVRADTGGKSGLWPFGAAPKGRPVLNVGRSPCVCCVRWFASAVRLQCVCKCECEWERASVSACALRASASADLMCYSGRPTAQSSFRAREAPCRDSKWLMIALRGAHWSPVCFPTPNHPAGHQTGTPKAAQRPPPGWAGRPRRAFSKTDQQDGPAGRASQARPCGAPCWLLGGKILDIHLSLSLAREYNRISHETNEI